MSKAKPPECDCPVGPGVSAAIVTPLRRRHTRLIAQPHSYMLPTKWWWGTALRRTRAGQITWNQVRQYKENVMRMPTARKGLAGCAVLTAIIMVLIGLFNLLRPVRSRYHAIGADTDRLTEEYRNAVQAGAPWVDDAEAVALSVAGYPNEYGLGPDRVKVQATSDGRLVYTMLDTWLGDDSISAREYRVELAYDGDLWTIVWAGWRQKCYSHRGGSAFVWTTGLCP